MSSSDEELASNEIDDEESGSSGSEGDEMEMLIEESSPADLVSTDTTFNQLGIGKWLSQQLDELNLKKPTPVQVGKIHIYLYLDFRQTVSLKF